MRELILTGFGGRDVSANIFVRPKHRPVAPGPAVSFDEPPTLTLAEVEFLLAKMKEMAE